MTEILIKATQACLNKFIGAGLAVDGILGKKTKAAIAEARARLKAEAEKRALALHEFVALRLENRKYDNAYSDLLVYDDGKAFVMVPCSTRPGLPYALHPVNSGGAAFLCEGAYERAWRAEFNHRLGFRSMELRQVRPVKVWRDATPDAKIDKSYCQEGLFGINIHSGGRSPEVGRWSAGCVVVPYERWQALSSLLKAGELYSATLIEL